MEWEYQCIMWSNILSPFAIYQQDKIVNSSVESGILIFPGVELWERVYNDKAGTTDNNLVSFYKLLIFWINVFSSIIFVCLEKKWYDVIPSFLSILSQKVFILSQMWVVQVLHDVSPTHFCSKSYTKNTTAHF